MNAIFETAYGDLHNTAEHIESLKKAIAFLDTIHIPMIAYTTRGYEHSDRPIPIKVVTDSEDHDYELVDLFDDYNTQNPILDNTGLFVSHDKGAAANGIVFIQKGMRL